MSLIKIIKNKEMRRIFGKKELEIIEKQLLGINLTASEKTRLSRDIRKKFSIVTELSKCIEEFKLKKGGVIKEIIESTKEEILKSKYFPKINKIVLFGSAAKNKISYRSDIDLAVFFSDIDKRESSEFRIRLLGKVNERIDIQVYNTLPEKIKKEIDKEGRVIWKRE